MRRISFLLFSPFVFFVSKASDMMLAQAALQSSRILEKSKTMLAIGDSLCTGQLPDPPNEIFFSDMGYNDKLFEYLKQRENFKTLVKVCCPGESSIEFLDGTVDVPPDDGSFCYGEGPDLPFLSQLDAAIQILQSKQHNVELISISLGGNDILPCVFAAATTDPAVCAVTRIDTLVSNLKLILDTLLSSIISWKAKRPPLLVAMTPYNPLLPFSLSDDEQEQTLAALSQLTLVSLDAIVTQEVYRPYRVVVVDGSDIFDGLNTTVVDGIPQNVRNICMYTGMCNLDENGVYVLAPPEERDVHPTEEGYVKLGHAHIDLLRKMKLFPKSKPTRPKPSPYGRPHHGKPRHGRPKRSMMHYVKTSKSSKHGKARPYYGVLYGHLFGATPMHRYNLRGNGRGGRRRQPPKGNPRHGKHVS